MDDRLKSLIPLHEIDPMAREQIYEALKNDFLKKLVIMPDVHAGYSLPIGGVALLDSIISPDYVGVDIGCGMCCHVYEDIDTAEFLKNDTTKKEIFSEIYRQIPTGHNSHKTAKKYKEFKPACGDKNLKKEVDRTKDVQLGTLGSGNHFIEIGRSRKGKLGITIHSGSRKLGHTIASHYMKLAKNQNDLPKGFFFMNSDIGEAYFEDMTFAIEYALENRLNMFKKVEEILGLEKRRSIINETHNHAIITKEGILHRKGATPAEKEQKGVIPGNMKDGVYITEGLGNNEYLSSASHGAGRVMGRNEAKRKISMHDFEYDMQGVMAKVTGGTLDEAPKAYKNIHDVVGKQDGVVVEIIDHIIPMINIKG